MNVSTYIAVEGWLAGEPQNLPNFPAAKQNLQNWRIVELFKIFSKELKYEFMIIRLRSLSFYKTAEKVYSTAYSFLSPELDGNFGAPEN